jgi:biotin/methionine sulfoxide reductase
MPSWQTPKEWLGVSECGDQLHLLNNQPYTKLHSQLDHGKISRQARIKGHEPLYIHPDDAQARGIAADDLVKVYNQRGAMICGAVISDNMMPGVILVSTGAWFDPDPTGVVSCKHGNPNVLTPDLGTSSLAQGPAAHSCLVRVEKWAGGNITVTAHQPPEIVKRDKK